DPSHAPSARFGMTSWCAATALEEFTLMRKPNGPGMTVATYMSSRTDAYLDFEQENSGIK
ncbi:MAG: hypothetical protein JNK79_06155, partial [Chitinophagaceae bacterium]|nr:hypothetical protein [Chitinophagaceae bacterium]